MNSSVMNLFVYFSCIVCVFSCALVQLFLVLAQYKCQVVVVVVVLGHHGITWGHNISGQGTCHRDDTGMSSSSFFFFLLTLPA